MKIKTKLSCTIELPDNFRKDDFLSFHKRDILMVAERVDEDSLAKGLMWAAYPACLTVKLYPRRAQAELAIDGTLSERKPDSLNRMLRRMLGLTQGIEDFEQRYRTHPQLGDLIAKHPGLRVPLAATSFEALTWAITGQQISVSAAVSVRRKLIQAAGLQHSSGLWCYPDANQITRLTEADLRQAGFSLTKAQTLIALSQGIEQNRLFLNESVDTSSVDEVRTQLLQIRGIGPWTINYALLRGFGWLDGSLHGDAAVRRNIQTLLGSPEKITEKQAQRWLSEFSPWRALVAAHLWAMQF